MLCRRCYYSVVRGEKFQEFISPLLLGEIQKSFWLDAYFENKHPLNPFDYLKN